MPDNRNYSLLSEYRAQLMGIAALWIVFFHMPFTINNVASGILIGYVKELGRCGVDIFLLLSGLGLYFSYKKNPKLSVYYTHRFKRVLPSYISIVTIYCAVLYFKGALSLKGFILNITSLAYIYGKGFYFDWFMAALMIIYLISPLIYKPFFNQSTPTKKYSVIAINIFVWVVFSAILSFHNNVHFLIITTRIPIFLLGILMGYWCDIKKKITLRHVVINIIIYIIGLVLYYLTIFVPYFVTNADRLGLRWYIFTFTTIPFCLFFAYIMDLLKKRKHWKFRFLKFCGSISFELYLWQTVIFSAANRLYGTQFHPYVISIVGTIAVFAISIIWKKLINIIFYSKKLQAKEITPQL